MRPFDWSSPVVLAGDGLGDRPQVLGRVPPGGLDFAQTFGPLHPGQGDPCVYRGPRDFWRASWTPEGAGTLHLFVRGDRVGARAFGPGALWLLDRARGAASLLDRPERFAPREPRFLRLRGGVRGLRLGRTASVLDTLLPTILGQRVKVVEARRSWIRLVRAFDARAPGPAPLWMPPEPRRVLRTPSWMFAAHGVDRTRAGTFVAVCRHAARLLSVDGRELVDLLRRIRGIGPWTLAHVRLSHLGDPDAVVVGDYNLPHAVGRFFTGAPRSSDEEMLRHLEPYAGQRARAVRWIKASGVKRVRFGPRTPLRLAP